MGIVLILKAGRTTATVSQRRLFKKFPGQKVKAHKLAQLKGLKKVKVLSKKYEVQGLTSVKDRPKTWKKRAELKSYYRSQIKSELKVAKIDRSIFRTQTVQKLDPKTGRYKTIRKYKKYTY